MTLGQEISAGSRSSTRLAHVERAARTCYELALGGTAVGTGLNAPADFGRRSRARSRADRLPFVTAPNKFEALAAHDALRHAHGALKTLAAR
jgi:fumarate hydratase class II